MGATEAEWSDRVVTVGTDPTLVRRDRDHVGSRGLASPDRAPADPERPARSEVAPDLLPEALENLLRRAHRAERRAVGPTRRVAWRTTRVLLGALIAAGYPPHVIAASLGVGADSVRTRAARDGWLPGPVVVGLLGIDQPTLRRWSAAGLLGREPRRDDAVGYYRALDLVRAVASRTEPLITVR